jgi:hypothetical protein
MKGWLIMVETKQLGEGGPPMIETYAAWISDQGKAIDAVRTYAKALDERVKSLRVGPALLLGLKVPVGEVRLVRATA